MSTPLSGLIAATLTPLRPCGALDLGVIPGMIDHLERQNIRGIYVCGSTGEGLSLTVQERCDLAEAFIGAARGRMTTIVHVGHNSLYEAKRLAEHAAHVGADMISATAPSYFKVTSIEMLVRSMAEIARSAPDLPFYYYHIPRLTGATLDMVEFVRAAGEVIPNFAGLKFTAPEIHEFQACQEADGGRYDVIWGTDEMLLSALVVGARAAIGSTYNIAGSLSAKLWEAFNAGDLLAARKYQSRSAELIRVLLRFPFHATLKSVMARQGVDCGGCRLPLASISPQEERELHGLLDRLGFDSELALASAPVNGAPHAPIAATHLKNMPQAPSPSE